jgi:hypothetical protein
MGGTEVQARARASSEMFTAGVCWTIGMGFAVLDAVTTWYAVTTLHMPEANPVARWAIAEVGISRAVALRVLLSALVLGLLAIGTWARVPHHRELVNRTCWCILVGAMVLWGIVAVSNTAQIAYLKLF